MASQIEGQRLLVAKLGKFEKHASVRMVAALGKSHQLAGLTLLPAAISIRQVEAQIFQRH